MTPALNFENLDLLSVGVAVAGMMILGFVTFFNNSKGASNRFFLYLAITASIWGIVNYAFYQVHSIELSFWLLKFLMFFAVWAAFFSFSLSYVFPAEVADLPPYYKRILIPLTIIVSILTLTPLVFSKVIEVGGNGQISQLINGPGIFVFGALVAFLNLGGITLLIKKIIHSDKGQRRPLQIFLFGVILMLFLIMIFNFILPAFLNDPRFVSLGAVFLFPFIGLTSYAILHDRLFNVKIIATEILAFILTIISLFEVILSTSLTTTVFYSSVFVLTLVFSILLIKSVRKEVEQRELLEKLDKELEDKNKQLDQLSKFKSELLSLASHQIRSPLAAIKGFVQLIVGGSYGTVDDKAKEALGKVSKQADELLGLINTLLDVRKVEEGKMEYVFAKTDLNKMVGDVVGLMQPTADLKKLEFKFVSPGHEVWVSADAEKLKQVVQNLVDNAIKYTPAGFVHVELAEAGGFATVTVADSGLGVASTLIPFLFEEFVRDERVKKEIRGTGLGLYIARKIAEAHGGKIWAESAGEGKGSAFHVSVPEVK